MSEEQNESNSHGDHRINKQVVTYADLLQNTLRPYRPRTLLHPVARNVWLDHPRAESIQNLASAFI